MEGFTIGRRRADGSQKCMLHINAVRKHSGLGRLSKGSAQTALPKLPNGGFPICQDRGLHGAKRSYTSIGRRRRRPANSYDDFLKKCTLTISYFISDAFTFRGKNIRISL